MASPNDFKVSRVIFKANRDVIAGTKTLLKKQLAETISGLVEFLVSNDLGRRRHDDGWFIWIDGCNLSWKHSKKLAQILMRLAIWDV